MKNIVALSLSGVLCALLCTGCLSSDVVPQNNGAGYGGGDPALTLLNNARLSLRRAFAVLERTPDLQCALENHAVPGGLEGRGLWGLLHVMTDDQDSYCSRFLSGVARQAKSWLNNTPKHLFELVDAHSMDDEDGTKVKAKTHKHGKGKIHILRDAVETLDARALAALIAHEVLHKVVPRADEATPALPRREISDSRSYGPFESGRLMLDTMAARAVVEVALEEDLPCAADTDWVPSIGLCLPKDEDTSKSIRLVFVGSGNLVFSVPYLGDGMLGTPRALGRLDAVGSRAGINGTELPLGMADMDNDGRRDIVFAHEDKGNRNAGFSVVGITEKALDPSTVYAIPEKRHSNCDAFLRVGRKRESAALGLGDLDGDGIGEIVAVGRDRELLAGWRGAGDSLECRALGELTYDGSDIGPRDGIKPLGLADIDGNNRLELLLVHENGTLLVVQFDSTGEALPAQELGALSTLGIDLSDQGSVPVDVVDADVDGYTDLVWLDRAGDVLLVRFDQGVPQPATVIGNLEAFQMTSESDSSRELAGIWRWLKFF